MKTELILQNLEAKHPGEKEYLQAVREVLLSIEDIYNQHPEFERVSLIERLVEPDRIFTFKVPWVDDRGNTHVNLGYRVQFNNAIGPYKGGMRFHPSVNLSILKFLGFEQTFKNALTTLPMGGAKGGSDFAPRGRSEAEIMRFCQAFMLELWRNLGPDQDVPAGDIGVGGREVAYMYGMYKKLTRQHTGTFTGKGLDFGGSILRPEATGYGALYFVNQMLAEHGLDIKGKTVAISGFGNVAWGAAKKATEMGAKVVTLSGPDGYVYDPKGVSGEKIDYMLELRLSGEDIVAPYAERYPEAQFFAGKKPWEQKVDIALPCATQNELNLQDAEQLVANGVQCVAEVHGLHCRGCGLLHRASPTLCPGQGSKLRRRGNLWPGNDAKCHAPFLDGRGSRCKAAPDYVGRTRPMLALRTHRRLPQLCKGRKHRRLYEGGARHDGTRHYIIYS